MCAALRFTQLSFTCLRFLIQPSRSYNFSYKMRALFCLAICVIIFTIVPLAMQLPSPPQGSDGQASASLGSERDPEKIEYIYLNEVRESRISKKSDRGETKDNEVELENSENFGNTEKADNLDSPKSVEVEEKEEEIDPYVCRRMARLQRVPLCVRLFDRPHYRDELKIKFSFLAYRAEKPECAKQELSFRSASANTYTDIQQEMFPCPGRHHPLRTNWKFDDYKDAFYVSSGVIPASSTSQPVLEGVDRPAAARTGSPSAGIGSEFVESELTPDTSEAALEYTAPAYGRTESISKRAVPDSLVVYKRELDADTERFYVYDIVENFQLQTLPFAIVTEYDVEEDLQAANAVSYNSDPRELEVIYIREMLKPLDPSIPFLGPGDRLSRQDTIANLYESELVTLCWLILDQPQYTDIDFVPRPPPKQMNDVSVAPQQSGINFQHSVDYNEESVEQTMYPCKPRFKRQSSNPERIRISSGARPNSYFVYRLFDGKGLGTYRIFEFVENLSIERATSQHALYLPVEWNTEEFERKFINVVRERDVKEDIVCKKLSRDQLRASCVRLFQNIHYAKGLEIFFNFHLSLQRFESCQTREVTIVTPQLQSATTIYHPMGLCEGRHDILRTDRNLDDYKDLFHIAQGPDESSVVVFRQNITADSEWFQVYDIVSIGNLLELEELSVTLYDIQAEYNKSLIPSYNSDKSEIEVIYIREMFKSGPVADALAGKSDGIKTALCCNLLGRSAYKALNFEISKAALYTWKTNVRTYQLAFVHSSEYNDEHVTQPMYPCYGKHVDFKVGWRKDEYLHRYKVSSGGRPNSFFLYSLLSTENQQRVYTVHEFIENFESLETLQPVEIKFEDVHGDILRGNLEDLGAPRKLDSFEVENGVSKPDETSDVKPAENTENHFAEPKSVEPPKIVIENQEPVRINRNESPIASKSRIPTKRAAENPNPIEIERVPPEVVEQVTVEKPIALSNAGEPKVETEYEEPIKPVQVDGVMKPVNSKEGKTGIKSHESTILKPMETDQDEESEVLKQVISEELITRPKPDEPIEDIENSKPVEEEELSEVLKPASSRVRKKWQPSNEPVTIAKKPRAVQSKPDTRVSSKPVDSDKRITRPKSRPVKTEVEKPKSMKNELEAARVKLRPLTSVNRVTPSVDSKPMKSDPASIKTRTSKLKQTSSQGFAPPEKVRTGRKISFKDESDSQSAAVF